MLINNYMEKKEKKKGTKQKRKKKKGRKERRKQDNVKILWGFTYFQLQTATAFQEALPITRGLCRLDH